MKKLLSLILISAQLLFLFGCASAAPEGSAVRFYYLRRTEYFEYGDPDGVLTYETRSPGSYAGNVKYLLTLYLQGPLNETLESPFPADCKLTDISLREEALHVTLSSGFQSLQGIGQTLACVCLAKTCFGLTDVQTVHILAESPEGHITSIKTITIDDLFPTE